jgi:tripartite-type tricarboxylate transporter receptor subunit TctC
LLVVLITIGAENANSQSYPARNITLVVAVAPGGGDDLIARLFASKLTDRLGKPVVVENRPGAGGIIGVSSVTKVPADGYTLLLFGNSHVANQYLRQPAPYDVQRDFTPISMLITAPLLLISLPSFQAKTLPDLVALSKANPDQFTYGSPGNGTTFHLAIEALNKAAGINLRHVAYRGSNPSITDLLAGSISLIVASYASTKSLLEGGTLRPIGTSSPKRSPVLPNVPTFAESGYPQADVESNTGIVAPAGTPHEIVARLSNEIQEIAKEPEIRNKLTELGWNVFASTPEVHAQFIKRDTVKLKKLISDLGMVEQ